MRSSKIWRHRHSRILQMLPVLLLLCPLLRGEHKTEEHMEKDKERKRATERTRTGEGMRGGERQTQTNSIHAFSSPSNVSHTCTPKTETFSKRSTATMESDGEGESETSQRTTHTKVRRKTNFMPLTSCSLVKQTQAELGWRNSQ